MPPVKQGRLHFLGIDPGAEGGMAAISPTGKLSTLSLGSSTTLQVWEWLGQHGMPSVRSLQYEPTAYAVIEEITPRPTSFFDKSAGKWRAPILRSTCLIYGSYCQLIGFLHAAGIPFAQKVPQAWQRAMGLPKKDKTETPSQWKNKAKTLAQSEFPGEKITLAVADAVLLALLARKLRKGPA